MRRRRNYSQSSLELLLDTMTNAFGGVLFLAILIAVQLQERSFSNNPEAEMERHVEMIKLAGRKEVLTTKLQWLEEQASRPSVDAGSGEELDEANISEVADIDARYQEFLAQRDGLSMKLTEKEQRLKEKKKAARERLAELEKDKINQDEVVSLLTQLEAKRAELESEQDKRTISGKLPVRRRAGNLREYHLVVRYGRVYSVKINGELNTRDFTLVNRTFIPKPTHGTRIEEFADRPRLRALPLQNYITIFVWEDSFGRFQAVKNALVKQGFKYRLQLLRNEDELYVGGGGGSDGMVQ